MIAELLRALADTLDDHLMQHVIWLGAACFFLVVMCLVPTVICGWTIK